MRLVEQGDSSIQIVRQALPQMSRHGIPITPPNYAVWFEYLRAGDGELKHEMDAALATGNVSVDVIEDLYRRYVDTGDDAALVRVREGLRGFLATFRESLAGAGESLSGYADSLSDLSGRLHGDVPAQDLAGIVDALSERTAAVVSDMTELRSQVEQVFEEVGAMTAGVEAPGTPASGTLAGIRSRDSFADAFRVLAADALERDTHRPCLLLLELDDVEAFAQAHGAADVEALIAAFAQVLADSLQPEDIVGRFGEKQFAVLLNDVRASAAASITEGLRAAVAALEVPLAAGPARVTLSGGAAFLREGEVLEELVERADTVLFLSLEAGGDRITFDT